MVILPRAFALFGLLCALTQGSINPDCESIPGTNLAVESADIQELNAASPTAPATTSQVSESPPEVVEQPQGTATPGPVACPKGFIVVDGKCHLEIQWCDLEKIRDHKCRGCEIGYLPKQGICVEKLLRFFEEATLNASQVGSVQPITALSPGQTEPIPAPSSTAEAAVSEVICFESDPNTGKCRRCYDGFTLDNGSCIQLLPPPLPPPSPPPIILLSMESMQVEAVTTEAATPLVGSTPVPVPVPMTAVVVVQEQTIEVPTPAEPLTQMASSPCKIPIPGGCIQCKPGFVIVQRTCVPAPSI